MHLSNIQIRSETIPVPSVSTILLNYIKETHCHLQVQVQFPR